MRFHSLRARLIVIILTPLLTVALAAALWQFRNATLRAEDIFDRGLLSAALAISRDVAISDGDALSPATRSLINDTSGGELFYHVHAPDGVFVTGYSTPPRPAAGLAGASTEPVYFYATYQGRNVRVLRFRDVATIEGITGLMTVSVWQDLSVRAAFVHEVLTRAIGVIVVLLLSVALIVWFGVGRGLRPLLDLEEAIARRTPSDLTPIRRPVPDEARGIVQTLNTLLDRVARRISSKDEFISNAAHQLRNPIAGVLALAEAVESAPNESAAKARSVELVAAAREATHLTNQLLSFERARGSDTVETGAPFDLVPLCQETVSRFEGQGLSPGVTVTARLPDHPIQVFGDAVMLREAVLNLLTNAMVHGGAGLTGINLSLVQVGEIAQLRVTDDGVGIPPQDHILAIGRFSQPKAGPGTGLGLPIAARVAENHGGTLELEPVDTGTTVLIVLPVWRDEPRPGA